jgi:hypothetical protein
MNAKSSIRDALTVFGLLLIASAPIATRAAESPAEHAAASDTKLVCRWGKQPGSQTKEQFCATPAQWRAFFSRAKQGQNPAGWQGYSESLPGPGRQGYSDGGMSGFGTGANQHSFQR